jgi:elongation factor Ts
MTITIQDIQALRQKTGAGMMDCKKALAKADGNFEEAENFLRESGLAAAVKKAERVSADGVAFADIVGGTAVLLEINTETDFAAQSAAFQKFVRDVAEVIALRQPEDTDSLMNCRMGDNGASVQEALQDKVLVFGEKIQIRRFALITEGLPFAYMHNGGRIGVIMQIDVADGRNEDAALEIGKELALQIASMNPEFVSRPDVPEERLTALKNVIEDEIRSDPKYLGKPKEIHDRILRGRIEKFFREKCLLEQAYIKDDSMTVGQFISARAKELDVRLTVRAFVRYEKGEGLHGDDEKSNEDFARELAMKK